MDEDRIAEYVERSQSVIDSSPQMNEESTKAKLIQPLIELLGWDFYSSEVELEYPMQIGRGNTRADYALQLNGIPVVFIEAKGCDSTLTDSDRTQLSSYMRQKGVDWGLLTNGNRFEVFKRLTERDRPEEVSLAQFPLENLAEQWSVMRLLSKELVETGEADTIAHRIEARKHAVKTLRSNKEDIAEQITQFLTNEVGDTLIQEIESESKEFVDELIDSLGTDSDADFSLDSPKSVPAEEVDSKPEGYLITIMKDGKEETSFVADNQSDVMAKAVDCLIQQHGLIDELDDFPYVPGKKKAILNTEPKHPSGEEMQLYREISDGYYVFVSLKQEDKKRYVERFATLCGLTVSFDGDW